MQKIPPPDVSTSSSKPGKYTYANPVISKHMEITMQAVAQEAGVSRATVSRAMRNHPAIPYSTRQRIKAIAAQIGYRPNPFVAALMSQLKSPGKNRIVSAPVIALVSAFPIKTGWRDKPSVTRMVEGVFAHATKLGFRIDTFYLAEPGMTDDRLSRILVTRGIQGVIILPTPKSGSSINLNWPKFSSVALGYSMAEPKLHRVCNHLAHTVASALDNIIKLGYRRIGMAMQLDTDARVDHSWRSGYLLYREMFPFIKFSPMLLTVDWNEQSFGKWFLKSKPEVVITDDIRVQEWLNNMSCKIPEDVGLILLDCSKFHCTCAGIDQHHEILGAAAVDLVVGQLYRNETGIPLHPKYVTIEGSWVDGLTLFQK